MKSNRLLTSHGMVRIRTFVSVAAKFMVAAIGLGFLSFNALPAQDVERALDQPSPPLLVELQRTTDSRGFAKLISRSMIEAETFRQSLFAGKSDTNSARGIAQACVSFRQWINQNVNHSSGQSTYDLARFRLDEQGIYDAMAGLSKITDPNQFYGSFQGKWYGIWDGKNVDHHWDRYTPMQPVPRFEVPGGEPVKCLGYQYAWVGDGYGLNHVASSADGSKKFLLGYVVHIRDQDLNREVVRRPHVGVMDGSGRLIWITAGEVFFEELIPGKTKAQDQYSITGFRYTFEEKQLVASKAFQAIYTRDSENRKPWRGFAIDLRVPPNNQE
jgi:hypothetical protein